VVATGVARGHGFSVPERSPPWGFWEEDGGFAAVGSQSNGELGVPVGVVFLGRPIRIRQWTERSPLR
jgi:hypothetical protein